jgi:hypothetical protein
MKTSVYNTDEPNKDQKMTLLQDESKELSKWFASRIDAMWVLRKVYNDKSCADTVLNK